MDWHIIITSSTLQKSFVALELDTKAEMHILHMRQAFALNHCKMYVFKRKIYYLELSPNKDLKNFFQMKLFIRFSLLFQVLFLCLPFLNFAK